MDERLLLLKVGIAESARIEAEQRRHDAQLRMKPRWRRTKPPSRNTASLHDTPMAPEPAALRRARTREWKARLAADVHAKRRERRDDNAGNP